MILRTPLIEKIGEPHHLQPRQTDHTRKTALRPNHFRSPETPFSGNRILNEEQPRATPTTTIRTHD